MRRLRSKMSFTMLRPTREMRRSNRMRFRLRRAISTASKPKEAVPVNCGRRMSKSAKVRTASAGPGVLLAHRRGQGVEADRSASELVDDGEEQRSVHLVEPRFVHVEELEGVARDAPVDP